MNENIERVETWQQKANRIIAALCLDAYRKANTKPDGTRYSSYRPYEPPYIARHLVECLDTNDEERAKGIFADLELQA